MDVEDDRSAEHQKADAEDARENRYEEPVTDIGDEFALAPPGFSRIAGPEVRQHRKYKGERDRDRHDLRHRLTYDLNNFHWQTGHRTLVLSET